MKNVNPTNDRNAPAPSWNPPVAVQRWDPETEWFPAVDVTETRDEYLFEVDLPGMRLEHLSFAVQENVLSISGERLPLRTLGRRIRIERPTGSFIRRFPLPNDARSAGMNAVFDNGVLELRIPRTHQGNSRPTLTSSASESERSPNSGVQTLSTPRTVSSPAQTVMSRRMKLPNLPVTILALFAALVLPRESTAASLPFPSSPVNEITGPRVYPGMPRLDFSKMPWLDYSKVPSLDYSKVPWSKQPPGTQIDTCASAQALVANLQAQIQTAASDLAALNASFKNEQQHAVNIGEATSLAADLSTLASQDCSTLLSQDLSINCGQLLSTSLAVPTAPPRPNWNRQAPVIARTAKGDVATYPPRTAWGNEGRVVTTPGGAVVTLVPSASETKNPVDSEKLLSVARELQAAQTDLARLQKFLRELNASSPVTSASVSQRLTQKYERD